MIKWQGMSLDASYPNHSEQVSNKLKQISENAWVKGCPRLPAPSLTCTRRNQKLTIKRIKTRRGRRAIRSTKCIDVCAKIPKCQFWSFKNHTKKRKRSCRFYTTGWTKSKKTLSGAGPDAECVYVDE